VHWFSRTPPGTILCDQLAWQQDFGIALLIAPKIINTKSSSSTTANTCEDLKRGNNECTKASGVPAGPGQSPGRPGWWAGYPPTVSAAHLFLPQNQSLTCLLTAFRTVFWGVAGSRGRCLTVSPGFCSHLQYLKNPPQLLTFLRQRT